MSATGLTRPLLQPAPPVEMASLARTARARWPHSRLAGGSHLQRLRERLMDAKGKDHDPAPIERRLPPGGFRRILTTPDGDQAGLQGQPAQPPAGQGNPSSGVLPPGGYYAIVDTPDGDQAGLNVVLPPEPPAA